MNKYINLDDLRQILIDNDIDHIQTNELKELVQIVDELPTITEQEIVKPYIDKAIELIEQRYRIAKARNNGSLETQSLYSLLNEAQAIVSSKTDTSNISMKDIFAKATESHNDIKKGWWKNGKDEVNRLYDRLKK